MSDEDAYYIGNLILNGMGDGQPSQTLSILPQPRRAAVSRARMQIRQVAIMRNFVQQIRALPMIPENAAARNFVQLQGNENQQENSQQQRQQRRSQSERRLRGTEEEGFRRGRGRGAIARSGTVPGSRRSRRRVRVRSLSRGASILQITAAPQRPVVDEDNSENNQQQNLNDQ